MKTTLIIISLFFSFNQTTKAQDGVRSSKKDTTHISEVKKVQKAPVNNERYATKDSTNNNAAKTNNPIKNKEKTSKTK